jgi:hypothetical protein
LALFAELYCLCQAMMEEFGMRRKVRCHRRAVENLLTPWKLRVVEFHLSQRTREMGATRRVLLSHGVEEHGAFKNGFPVQFQREFVFSEIRERDVGQIENYRVKGSDVWKTNLGFAVE